MVPDATRTTASPRARPATRRRGGFTLVELLVAIGIFSVVLIIVVGAISAVIDANKKAQTLTSVVNNLNFTLESMTREIKTGTELQVADGGAGACGTSVTVLDARRRYVTYGVIPDPLDGEGNVIAQTVIAEDGEPIMDGPITAPEIEIDELCFYRLDGDQPAVLFTVSGAMDLGGSSGSSFRVQSTVAQRALNIPT